jgi:ligand-binding sensor domain-containing protein/class 3 adenylate cyclase
MKPKSPFYFVLLFLLMETCPALPQEIFFNKVLPPEGRVFDHVAGIVQDIQGYMWFATKKGLFRYDGYQMTAFKNNPSDTNSLTTDALEAICVDSTGIFWIATFGKGIERFDPATGIFTHFRNDSNEAASLSSDWVPAVFVDHEGTLWAGTGNGLDRFDAQTGKFIHFRNQPNDPESISCNDVRAIYEDKQGTLWIGTGNVYEGKEDEGGLNRMNKKTGKFTRYLHDPKNPYSLINNKVRAIFEDSKGNFWVGTSGDGLHTMDRTSGKFQRHLYDPAHPEKLSRPPFKKKPYNDYITFITEEITGAIWIGTAESGLNYYDPKTKTTRHYELEKDTAGAFTDRTAWWAYNSKDDNVWIGTLWGNLYRINPHRKSIPYYESLDGPVNSIYEEADGSLWRGTQKGLQLQYNQSENETKRFVNDPGNPASLSNNSIQVIKKDRRGNIWVGTEDGLNLLDTNKGTFTRYRNDTKNPNSLSDNFILSIYEDRQSNLWIGTAKGLNRMNREAGSFQRYIFHPADTGTLFINVVSAVLEDRQGQIWVGCQMVGDIHQLNTANGKFTTYLNGKGILCFCEDDEGTFWAGGEEGVFQYSRATDSFIPFSDSATHTEFSFVRSIGEDEKRNLWIGSSKGILQLNQQRIVTRIYGKSYGINGNDLGDRSFYKGKNGKLYFGTYSGYFVFLPGQLAKDLKPPQIVFSDFRLTKNRIQIVKNNLLPVSPSQAKTIRLQHNQNTFSFDFAAIDYSSPEDNRHFFMLENYNEDWIKAGSERRAMYYNVPPGKYVFRVKAANSNGIWAERSIDIVIAPPFWQTWWFKTLMGIIFAALLYGIYRWRTATLHKQKRILELTVKERTAEVVKQKEKSDELLLNILPSEVAEELKEKGYTTAKAFDEVTVLFSDIKGFTNVAEKMTAQELVKEINTYFSVFDGIIQKYGLEKIKTIGDAYIAAGGLPEKNSATAQNVVEAAIAMQQEVEKLKQERVTSNKPYFELRIGIHTGPVVAGVVGIKKFQYDIWGDTVNLAARMEQSGVPGKINISQHTYELVKEQFNCVHRGKIEAKNKGEIDMYFVEPTRITLPESL